MITKDTPMGEIRKLTGMEEVFPFLVGGWDEISPEVTLISIEKEHPTWSAEDMAYGLNRLAEIAVSGERYVFSVYGEKDIAEDSKKKNVKLVYFPAEEKHECVILAAGGAYGAVCSLSESFPVAARLNELGYPVFCLNYRTGAPKLMPKPMEDMAEAVKYLREHEARFSIDMNHYAVGGFSAGGHLAATWGTSLIGAAGYGLPVPEILLLDYAMISMWKTIHMMPEHIAQFILKGYFGDNYSEEDCRPYNVEEHVDENYPPVYFVQAEDDDTVPPWNAELFRRTLVRNHVPCEFEIVSHGNHGFGLGSRTDAAGWVDRAVQFWKNNKKKCPTTRAHRIIPDRNFEI